MLTTTSRKTNTTHINSAEFVRSKTTKCKLLSLTLWWWWWWCKEDTPVWCLVWDPWDLWEDNPDKETTLTKDITEEITVNITEVPEDKTDKLNRIPNPNKLLPPLKKWPLNLWKPILENSLRWKKRSNLPFSENFFTPWSKKSLKIKTLPLKLPEC